MSSEQPLPAASDGRLHDGTFAKGNAFGKGNPHLKRAHALRAKLQEITTDEALEQVVKKLQELAIAGDVQAIGLWLAYALGKPTAAITITGEDGGPIETASAAAVLTQSSAEILAWRRQMTEQLMSLTAPPTEESPPTG